MVLVAIFTDLGRVAESENVLEFGCSAHYLDELQYAEIRRRFYLNY